MTPQTPAHWHHLRAPSLSPFKGCWSRVVYSFLLYRPWGPRTAAASYCARCPSKQPFFLALRRSAAEQAPDQGIERGNAARGWVEKDGGRKRAAWWISASRLRRRSSLPPLLLRSSTWLLTYCSIFLAVQLIQRLDTGTSTNRLDGSLLKYDCTS